jgi:periplasmic protein TonB
MNPHGDILDEQERLGKPLIGSLVLHAGVVAFFFAFAWWNARTHPHWGAAQSLGGSVGVDVVNKIPLPNRNGPQNPVANDTRSHAPQPPPPKEKPKKEPPPKPKQDVEAIPLKGRTRPEHRPSKELAQVQKYQARPPQPNQIYNSQGARAQSPIFGMQGVGGVGIGQNTVIGQGCGGYLDLLRGRIQAKWDAQGVSSMARGVVIADFTIQRDGTVTNTSILQSSGNFEVDTAAQRAIIQAEPFPPFLPACQGSSARIEVDFEPKR